ncbi:uncharacterized protein PHACADRAFT_58727, partial [Phanerochaete carnosa HHB-10118-sp]
ITRLHKTCIWDVVPWTQPKQQTANVSLRDKNGNSVLQPDEMAKILQEQFTPSGGKPVDHSIIDEMPDMPAQDMPLISDMLLVEALAQASNFSPPGSDHVDWFW